MTGTHDWNKFLTPDELTRMIEDAGCNVRCCQEMLYVPGFNKWQWLPSNINYAMHAIKRS